MDKEDHINYALIPKRHSPMYYMHKYWARKPANIVSEYIKKYSKEGDIVFDPFVGSGVTAIEAIKQKRKAIGFDLDPMALFISRITAMPIGIKEMDEIFQKIKDKTKKEIYKLYETNCPKCKGKGIISHVVWKTEEGRIKIVEEWYFCSCNKDIQRKDADKDDFSKLEEIEKSQISYWYPQDRFIWNSRINIHRDEKVSDLFTKRNLIALSFLLNEINSIKNRNLKDLFRFVFTAFVAKASKLNFVNVGGYRSKGRGWTVRGFWVPKEHMEQNVWNDFEAQYKSVRKGKDDSNKQIRKFKEANTFNELKNEKNILLKQVSALDIESHLPENSIDYIFTDPPYGDAVPYLELNSMWSYWLKFSIPFEDEIIISDSPERKKDSNGLYHKMLKAAFRQIYRVLKPNKYLTVTFHNTDISIWNSIIKAVTLAGFDLEKIVYQMPAKPSAKGLLAPYASAVGDYYIRFIKPKKTKIISEKEMDLRSYEREVVLSAKRILEERGEPTIYQHILNGIMVELKGGRYAPIGARKFEDILKDNVTSEFELIPVKDDKGKTVGKKWWLKGRDFSNFTTPALSDRIERVVLNVLDKKVKASFDDVLQEIFIEFPNALTPDTQDIKDLLEEYATKTKDGKWRLKAELQESERTSLHNKMIYYLAQLGKKAGFDIWIGQREQGETYNGKPLRDLCDKVRSFRFVPQESSTIDRIKMIDVLWLEDGRIKYEFEVENTTGISEAIIRGSHIPEELKVKRFIIIPKERERKLNKKLQEPILQQAVKKNHWGFLRYKDLESLYKATKKKFNPAEIHRISKMPEDKPEGKQTNLFAL